MFLGNKKNTFEFYLAKNLTLLDLLFSILLQKAQ